MEMHYAHPGEELKASKTVALHVLPRGASVSVFSQPIVIQSFQVNSALHTAGRIPWVPSFKYLGFHITADLSEDLNIKKRVAAARSAFGALRCVLCDRFIDAKVRGRLYVALVLSILVAGCECWSYSVSTQNTLQRFHNYCCRAMAKISRRCQWKRKIKTDSINGQFGIPTTDHLVRRRVLQWLGHVARMDADRAPKRLMFGWSADGAARYDGQRSPNDFARQLIIGMVTALYDSNSGLHPPFQLPPPIGGGNVFGSYILRAPAGEIAWSNRNDRRQPWAKHYGGRQMALKSQHSLAKWARFANWHRMAQDRVFWRRCCGVYLKLHADPPHRERPGAVYEGMADSHDRIMAAEVGPHGCDVYAVQPPQYQPPYL
jgi:hypothetical protein